MSRSASKMAKFYKLFLFAVFVTLAASSVVNNEAVDDSNNVEEQVPAQEDVDIGALPSMLGMLGSKLPVADTIYDEYDDDDESSDDDEDAAGNIEEEAPTAPCCFPDVWQGVVKSDFGFVPIGGGRREKSGYDDDDNDDDDMDKKGKKHRGHYGKKGCHRRRGRAVSARAIDTVYIDGVNRRFAGDKIVYSDRPGKPLNFSYIVLLGANGTADMYLFSRSYQKCRHRKLSHIEWHKQCLPPNATLRGKFSLGPAAGGLSVESWGVMAGTKRVGASIVGRNEEVVDDIGGVEDGDDDDDALFGAMSTTKRPPRPRPRPRPRVFIGANVLVTPGSCVPVVIQEEGVVIVGGGPGDEVNFEDFGVDLGRDDDKPTPRPRPRPKPRPSKARGEAFVGSVYFSNVQAAIRDPSVFTPPTYCSSTANALYFDNMEDVIPSILERFLVL